jgi:hypothetical protein
MRPARKRGMNGHQDLTQHGSQSKRLFLWKKPRAKAQASPRCRLHFIRNQGSVLQKGMVRLNEGARGTNVIEGVRKCRW